MRHKLGRYYARLYVGDKEKWVSLKTTLISVAKARMKSDDQVNDLREAKAYLARCSQAPHWSAKGQRGCQSECATGKDKDSRAWPPGSPRRDFPTSIIARIASCTASRSAHWRFGYICHLFTPTADHFPAFQQPLAAKFILPGSDDFPVLGHPGQPPQHLHFSIRLL